MRYKNILVLLLVVSCVSSLFAYDTSEYKRKYEGYYIRDDHFASAHLLIKYVKDKIYDVKIIAFSEDMRSDDEFNKLAFRVKLVNDVFVYEEDLLPDSKFGLFLRFVDNKILVNSRDHYDFLKPKVTFVGRYIKSNLGISSFFDIFFGDDYMHDLDRYRIEDND
jgi:hypothetical protein